jgi:TRAP-type C4-dicarboxylate transport system substrate-binding protein
MLWRLPALVVVVVALAAALSACGSSSAGTSTTETAERATTTSVPEGSGAPAEAGESAESELEGIIRIQIFGKFGGTRNQFDLLSGGHCKIVKINTTPASVKADPHAILDHEKNASVQVAPLKGATEAECREALESAIG